MHGILGDHLTPGVTIFEVNWKLFFIALSGRFCILLCVQEVVTHFI